MPERHKTNENYNLTFQNELKEIQWIWKAIKGQSKSEFQKLRNKLIGEDKYMKMEVNN